MKTVKLNGSPESNMILRLPDATAQEIVNKGGGQYVPKSAWKDTRKQSEEPIKKPPAKSKRQRKKKESA